MTEALSAVWKARLSASGMDVNVREMQPDEKAFVFESTCKVRWPRRGQDQFTWYQWRDIYGPTVNTEISNGRTLVAMSGGIILGYLLQKVTGAVSMLYVKSGVGNGLRGHGVGLMLLDYGNVPDTVTITSPTAGWERWTKYHGIPWQREDARQ